RLQGLTGRIYGGEVQGQPGLAHRHPPPPDVAPINFQLSVPLRPPCPTSSCASRASRAASTAGRCRANLAWPTDTRRHPTWPP
ncbi:hypothetical protein, partial [Hymenobacter coccineus]|uniref:hypothetical protein n=1 Tax=Hymenobacter coccineus TaxID=1908235 RepID=UPI0013014449